MLNSIRLAALTLSALTLGLSFAHVLEMPAKLAYAPPVYVALQNSLYVSFGLPGVGAFVEPAAIVATGLLAYRVRHRRGAFWLTVGAATCLLLAFPVVFFLFTDPANAVFQAAVATVPPDFERYRIQWEYSHAARFVLHLAAFVLLARSVLHRPRAPRSELSPYTMSAIQTEGPRSYSPSSPLLGEGPPSMTMVAPFMKPDASEARKTQG
jgi:Domain of unknown function (DUF1772)